MEIDAIAFFVVFMGFALGHILLNLVLHIEMLQDEYVETWVFLGEKVHFQLLCRMICKFLLNCAQINHLIFFCTLQ